MRKERDHRVLNELAAERVAQAKQLPSGPGGSPDAGTCIFLQNRGLAIR